MKKFLFIILFCISCATSEPSSLIRDYSSTTGVLFNYPTLDETNRLFIYLQTDKGIITGVLDNQREAHIIRAINKDLEHIPLDSPIVFYGNKVKGYQEVLEGIDYEVIGIVYYHTPSKQYRLTHVAYQKSTKEVLRDFSFSQIIPILLEQAKKLL